MMPRQALMQMRYRLRSRVWSITSGATVFGSVHVTHKPSKAAVEEFRTPLVLMRPGDEKPDPELPGKCLLEVEADLVVAVAGDRLGENAILSGNVSDRTKSEGRGILEVEREFKGVLRQMGDQEGIRIIAARTAARRAAVVSGLGYVVMRSYNLSVHCTDEPYYHPPMRLVATAQGAGVARLVWADPPDRFDRRPITIRRAAGATAPASPTAGTAVATVAIGVQTYDDTPGAGQFSYALFAGYTDSGAAADESFSAQEEGTTRTLTVT
jgi:hypothetical protein